jgi:hypothetical protein
MEGRRIYGVRVKRVEDGRKQTMRLSLLMLLLAASGMMAQTTLTVKAISHSVENTSTGSHTSCNTPAPTPGLPTMTNCNSRNTAVVVVRNTVVGDDGNRYIIGCTARWIWQDCEPLIDGEKIPATIKTHDMEIVAHQRREPGQAGEKEISHLRHSTGGASAGGAAMKSYQDYF